LPAPWRRRSISASSRHIDRIARLFRRSDGLHPDCFQGGQHICILTTEYVEGIKISHIDQLDAAGYDGGCFALAEPTLSEAGLSARILPRGSTSGTFSRAGNVICLLDFGMVGVVDRQTRDVRRASERRRAPQ